MKNKYLNSKVFETLIALVIIPLAYFLMWNGFEFLQKPDIYAKRGENIDVVSDFMKMVKDPGSENQLNSQDRSVFEKVTGIMNSGENTDSGSGKDIDVLEKLSGGNRFVIEPYRNDKGYYFKNVSGSIESDGGMNVLHVCPNVLKCPEGNAMPRIICQDIFNEATGKSLSSRQFGDSENSLLHLKPVLRISKSDFDVMDERPVIGIIIKDQEKNSYDTIVISVRNFADKHKGEYEGQYKEDFQSLELMNSLEVQSEKVFGKNGRKSYKSTDSEPEIKIYWYGQVEVWFDKLIIDDDIADNLFSTEDYFGGRFDPKISECTTPGNFRYMLDKIKKNDNTDISNQICVNYVLDKMYKTLYTVQNAKARNPEN